MGVGGCCGVAVGVVVWVSGGGGKGGSGGGVLGGREGGLMAGNVP